MSCTGRAPEAKAERIIAEELERQGWQESDLAARPKSDAVELLEMTQAMADPFLGDVGWISFTGGNGTWTQVTANNLVAPAKAANALITLYATTGAVLHGYGAVLIDDVTLAPTTASPGQTNEVSSAMQAAKV